MWSLCRQSKANTGSPGIQKRMHKLAIEILEGEDRPTMNSNPGITKSFNAALFLYWFCAWVFLISHEPKAESVITNWDRIGEWSPILELVLAFLSLFILLFWGGWLLKQFWNQFLEHRFPVRPISYDEGLALALVFSIMML